MKHEFTEDDLKQALRHTAYMDDGLRINIPAWIEDNDEVDTEQVDVFRAILDALPEPAPVAEEWEECRVRDLQKGDRYMVTGEDWKVEGVVANPGAMTVCYEPVSGLSVGEIAIDKDPSLKLFRIPAPVQHPDPEQHPVIMGVVTRDGSNHDFGVRNWSTYHVYSDGQSKGFINSYQITDWSPAEILPLNTEAGDDRG